MEPLLAPLGRTMRLTLRTLLSYLDEVHLSEEEREAIRHQIESSENASEWIHRTRDVMRRLKLGAPEIDGTGSADDPNTVAEYLDRTLPDESVAEFERVSLESDAMLAEVAACHHVLAMFLAEATNIDPDTRGRLHRLKADLEARAREAAAPAEPAPAAESEPLEPPPRRIKQPTVDAPLDDAPAVPEYLRKRRQSELKRWAPAIAALLLLAITAAIAFLPGGPLNPGGENIAAKDPTAEPAPPNVAGAVDQRSDGATIESEDEEPIEPADPEPQEAEVAESQPPAAEPLESATAEDPSAPAGGESAAADSPAMEQPAISADEPTAEPSPEPQPEDPQEIPPLVYVGAQPTLAVYEQAPGSWRKLTPGFEFIGPVRVVSLPSYRSRIEFGGATRIELVGLTEITITPPSAERPAGVDLAHGRVIVSHSAESSAPAILDLTLDGRSNTLTLAPGVAVAIDGDRVFQPGWPVDQGSPPLLVRASTLSGAAEWSVRGQTARVPMPEHRWLTGDDPAPPEGLFDDLAWVERLPLTTLEEDAAVQVAAMVKPNEPIWPQLREIAEVDPFVENRTIAGAGSAALGHPDPIIALLREVRAYRAWPATLTQLRKTISRSPEQAEVVAQVLEEKYGAKAAEEQMDLLVGFTAEEIGGDAEAVARGVVPQVILPALRSTEIATRVLAGLVLEEVVTGVDGRFDARASSRRREAAIRVIENRLSDAELAPRPR